MPAMSMFASGRSASRHLGDWISSRSGEKQLGSGFFKNRWCPWPGMATPAVRILINHVFFGVCCFQTNLGPGYSKSLKNGCKILKDMQGFFCQRSQDFELNLTRLHCAAHCRTWSGKLGWSSDLGHIPTLKRSNLNVYIIYCYTYVSIYIYIHRYIQSYMFVDELSGWLS